MCVRARQAERCELLFLMEVKQSSGLFYGELEQEALMSVRELVT